MSSLMRAESPPGEKRSLQPPSLAELDSIREDDKAEARASKMPERGLHMKELRQFLLPETLVSLELDTKKDDYWQPWNDTFKILLATIADKNANFFAYQFMRKIFNPLRKCANCSKYNTTTVATGIENPLELFITDRGVVGRIKIHCVNCGDTEPLTSCEDPEEIPTDPRVQITLEKTKGDFVKRITHHEVLHDLMELLHIAAIEHCAENKKKHLELAEFLLHNARKVCEQWCRLDYRDLRIKKFIRFREEVLLVAHDPSYMPACTREYMEMYEMMANSFRQNRDHIHTILQAIKNSLIDSPSRSHCMFWIAIALLHAENYYKFKRKYDPRSCMRIDEGEYWALHDRYIGLDAPVGVKKIPVVFVLFELPRFYHYLEFLEKNCGRRTKIYLTKEEKYELGRADKEAIKRGFTRPKKTGVIISPEKHLDFLMRQEELVKMTRNKEFVDAFKKKQTDTKKKKREKKKAIRSSASSLAINDTPGKENVTSLKTPDQESEQNATVIDNEADRSSKDESPIEISTTKEVQREKDTNEHSKTPIESQSDKGNLECNEIELEEDMHRHSKEIMVESDLLQSIKESVSADIHIPTKEVLETKLVQIESASASSVSCASSSTVPLISFPPKSSILASSLHDSSVTALKQPLSLRPKPNPSSLDHPSTDVPLLDSPDCLSSLESKPEPKLDPLDPKLDHSELKPNLSPTDCSLASKTELDHLWSLKLNRSPSLALPDFISTPNPEPIFDPVDRSLPRESDSSLVSNRLSSVESKPNLVIPQADALAVSDVEQNLLDMLSINPDPEIYLPMDVRMDLLDRPVPPDYDSKVNQLHSIMSPDDFKRGMNPKEAAEFLLSKLDIKRTLEIYSKLGISVKDYPLAELPILLKDAPSNQDSEIPFLLDALPDKIPYPEVEEKLLRLAVEKMAYDAVAAQRCTAENMSQTLMMSTDELDLKPTHETDPRKLKKAMEDAIIARLREKHGISEENAIVIIDTSDSRLGSDDNIRKMRELFNVHAEGKSTSAIEHVPNEEEQKAKDERTKSQILVEAHKSIYTLLLCGDASRLEHYLDKVYKENVWDVFLCYIDLKVCNRALGVDPDHVRKPAKPSVQEYHEVLAIEMKKYIEQKKQRKPRIVPIEVDPAFKGKMNPSTYVLRGVPIGDLTKDLPRNAMICTQISTEQLRSQGYKVDSDFSMMSIIVDRNGVLKRLIEGLETGDDIQEFIEKQLKVPKRKSLDSGGVGYVVLPNDPKPGCWKSAKDDSVKFTGNPKKAKKRAKKLAKQGDPQAKKPSGKVKLGKRSFTPEEMEALSVGTHPLMEGLPEIDPDVDPFDVESLKTMHPWLKIVENTVMEPKNEEELESVYDKMMTPVPVKGLDPKTPRQVIACPQSRDTKDGNPWGGIGNGQGFTKSKLSTLLKSEAKRQKSDRLDSEALDSATVESEIVKSKIPTFEETLESDKLESETKSEEVVSTKLSSEAVKYEAFKSGTLKSVIVKSQQPSETLESETVEKETVEKETVPQKLDQVEDNLSEKPDKSAYKLVDTAEISSPFLSMLGYIPEHSSSPVTINKDYIRNLTEEEERDIVESYNILDMLKIKAERSKVEEDEKKKKKIDDSKVPHRQMRILDAMEVPYRLDNIKVVMGSDDSEANILSKITLLPYDKSSDAKFGGPRTLQAIKNTSIEPHLSKNQKKKSKMREKLAKMKSDLESSAIDSIDDIKSSSSATSLSGGSNKSDEIASKQEYHSLSVSSNLTTESDDLMFSGVDCMDEIGDDNGANGKSRMTARDRFKNCANCDTVIKDRIQLCSGCKKVAYCNSVCQKANWKTHKKTCTYTAKKRTG